MRQINRPKDGGQFFQVEKKKKKSHRSPIKAKSNIFEDKMMKFLKEKYREEPEKEEELPEPQAGPGGAQVA